MKLLQPPKDTWPTYNGDYSGRRYSTLTQINAPNIGSLSLNWMYRIANVGAQRGVGNPCPLVLIGLPSSIVTFGESRAEVKKLLGDDGDLFGRDE